MKRIVTFVLVVIITCAATNISFAKEPGEFIEKFFIQIKAGEIDEAYDNLFAGSGIPKMKPQAVEMIKMQTASGLPMYGKIIEFEKVREEKFGTSIIRFVYILKSEKAPLIWEFYFYKPTSNWFLANILFNDQFQLLDSKK
ncbi:MAG: hypothetical protein K8S27_04445 [Candidatus Omnitrophica bacterium]|nr:hypothetical protein [Candidatus Omnitrophota bacterium]